MAAIRAFATAGKRPMNAEMEMLLREALAIRQQQQSLVEH
jgi:hypothetical protein